MSHIGGHPARAFVTLAVAIIALTAAVLYQASHLGDVERQVASNPCNANRDSDACRLFACQIVEAVGVKAPRCDRLRKKVARQTETSNPSPAVSPPSRPVANGGRPPSAPDGGGDVEPGQVPRPAPSPTPSPPSQNPPSLGDVVDGLLDPVLKGVNDTVDQTLNGLTQP